MGKTLMPLKELERSQADDLQELYSEESGLDCTDSKDMARQEFKEEVDVNNILKRGGLDQIRPMQQVFGEVDYSINLQEAYTITAEAIRAYNRLPEHIKQKYPNWVEVLKAADNGTLEMKPKPKDEPAPATPAKPAGTP